MLNSTKRVWPFPEASFQHASASSKAVSPSNTEDTKCRLCQCELDAAEDDDLENNLCFSCKSRPEARRLGVAIPVPLKRTLSAVPRTKDAPKSARDFTVAEKGLIKKVHGYMQAQQLLDILNERLVCDLGPDAIHYTMEQLYAEIGDASSAVPKGGHDFASLRKLLAKAKRDGVLDGVTEQVINDFAVVFSLNQKQLLSLKDIVLQPEEE
jgi:hypothetical protein